MRGRWGFRFALVAGALSLAACDDLPFGGPNPPDTSARPEARVAPPPDPVPVAESEALALYYRRVQADLLAQGLLRTDGGGPDTPFTDVQLAQNFVRIALFEEYTDNGGVLRSQQRINSIHRWDSPIRMNIRFGDSVGFEQRVTDRNAVASFARRLSGLTGVPITQTTVNPNFHVLFLSEAERRAFGPELLALEPNLSQASVNAFLTLPRDQYCIVIGTFVPGTATYRQAIVLIRAEHPDMMRLSCIHEELAQGMGLANDSPRARPSIFNDDEEFGLLTSHDELLLKMLYDDRLYPGMSAAEAAPIARQLAREYLETGPV